MVKILAALSTLYSSGASPGATEKVATLVVRASHSSDCKYHLHPMIICNCVVEDRYAGAMLDKELCDITPMFVYHS